jgi:CheY-like chemotaxis protein
VVLNGTGTLKQRSMGRVVLWELQLHTEQIRNQRQLTQLGALSGGLFHAIRNPLTIVQGRIELLQMLSSDPTLSKNYQTIMEQCVRIGHLLDTTQGITVQKIQRTQYSLQALLQGHFGSEMFHADSMMGQQYVIFNDQSRNRILIDIIKDRLERHGSIKQIALSKMGQEIHWSIEPDLDQDGWQFWATLLQICEQGSAMSQTGSTREQHLQSLKVLIQDCGLGYAFQYGRSITFRFPAYQQDDGQHKILIVDDDLDLRETLVELLSMDGFQIVNVNSAEEAMIHINDDLDVILLDVNLMGMSGLELVDILREKQPRLLSRIILISGMGSVSLPSDVLFLQKPFSKRSLNEMIDRVISNRSSM